MRDVREAGGELALARFLRARAWSECGLDKETLSWWWDSSGRSPGRGAGRRACGKVATWWQEGTTQKSTHEVKDLAETKGRCWSPAELTMECWVAAERSGSGPEGSVSDFPVPSSLPSLATPSNHTATVIHWWCPNCHSQPVRREPHFW